jgi:pyruvate dehydrogenase E2 component (dihydrolipoamide acetyltransferase)
VVPVLHDAQDMSLTAISREARALVEKARTSGLSVEQMSDGTFTISNLGMFGVQHFEAIINPPQVAILAVGAAVERPVVRQGAVAVGLEMTCTLSADHRVVDGAMAAQFVGTLKQMLENPAVLLV